MTSVPMLMPPQVDQLESRARILTLAGAILLLIGGALNPAQGVRSYLFGFLFWLGVGIGCLSLLMIHHLSGGAWGLGIRRILEAGSRTLRYGALLFLPLAIGMKQLFSWADPALVAADPILSQKAPYLNVPFFLVRAVFYFACWGGMAHLLSKWSLERDHTGDPALSDKLQALAGGGLVLMGLTITFASVDWAMSLNPHWFSTIYGVLFMVGQALSALAFVIVLLAIMGEEEPLASVVSKESMHDLGKLMFAFVMLWAYISLSQFLIIWSANLPEEIPWYITRLQGGWQVVAILLVIFHFALPFLLLLSRDLKRNARMLAGVAAGVFLMRLLDLFWLVAPDLHGHGEHAAAGLSVHWLDLVAPVFVGGVWLSLFARELRSRPLLTPGDPELQDLLTDEAHETA